MAGNQAEAVSLYDRLIALDPGNLEARFYLGWIYKMQGKTDEAITEFKKVIEINPNHPGAYDHLGDLYLGKGMLDEALAAFNKAVTLSPDSAEGYYKLGMAYRHKGRTAEAGYAFFEAGLLAMVNNNKDNKGLALNAYNNLKEAGNTQLAVELQGVLNPWFDPANEVVTQPHHSRSRQ
jgi:tetratricopeptide (TPR) repeat protein